MEAVLKEASTIKGIIRRYYAVWLMYSFAGGFLFGVYPIFLKSRGLTQFQINSVLATYFVVLFFTDVPTGAFADALGRRRSFVAGTLLRVTAFIVYFFAHHYYVFLIAESIDGIGTTFCNGAIDAWGVDALDEAGYEDLKDRLFSRISQISNAAFMGSAMLGAYAADVDIAWPWLLGAAGFSLSCVVGATLMRGEKPRSAHLELRSIPVHIAQQVRSGIQLGLGAETVLKLSLAGAITFAAWAPYWLEWPIMFNERFSVGVWIIGWIYSGLTIARMIGAEITIRIGCDEYVRAARVSLLLIVASVMLAAAGVFGQLPVLSHARRVNGTARGRRYCRHLGNSLRMADGGADFPARGTDLLVVTATCGRPGRRRDPGLREGCFKGRTLPRQGFLNSSFLPLKAGRLP